MLMRTEIIGGGSTNPREKSDWAKFDEDRFMNENDPLLAEIFDLLKKQHFSAILHKLKDRLTTCRRCSLFARAAYELCYFADAYEVLIKAIAMANSYDQKLYFNQRNHLYANMIFLYRKMKNHRERIPVQWMQLFRFAAARIKNGCYVTEAAYGYVHENAPVLLD